MIGVAADDMTDEQLRDRARQSIEQTGEQIDDEVFGRFADRSALRQGRLRRRADVRPRVRGAGRAQTPDVLPGDSAVAVRHRGGRPGQGRPRLGRAASRRREAVRPRPRVGAGARGRSAPSPRRVTALPDRPLPRQDGTRGDPLPAVREHDARAGVEPQLPRLRPDHDGRELRRGGPWSLLRSGRRAAGRRREPPSPVARDRSDGATLGARSGHARGRQAGRVSGDTGRRSGPLHPRSVRRLPRHRRRRGRTRPPRPTSRSASRSTTGDGRASRSSCAPASTWRSGRPSCGCCSSTRPACTSSRTGTAGRSPTRSCSRSIRRPGSG